MKVKVCNSGSCGNTYILSTSNKTVILDCGVPFKEVLKALDYKISDIAFAVCSHIHGDHSKYIKDYLKMGIKVLMPKQVKDKYSKEYDAIELSTMQKEIISGISIIAFKVPHDNDVECFAYLIEDKKIGKTLYITDCMYCPYDLSNQNINFVLCECNYDENLLRDNYEISLQHRIESTHLELQTCKWLIQTINSPDLRSVGLLHLSSQNGNPERFREEVEELVDCDVDVWVAEKGIERELRLEPF